MKRAVITLKSVRWEMEPNNIGYVRITSFSEQTDSGLKSAIAAIKTASQGQSHRPGARPAQQPGRLARSGHRGLRRLPGQGEIVSTRGRNPRRWSTLECRSRRPDGRQAGHRADQRRLGLGLGNRLRCAAGPPPRDPHGHQVVRQGLGAVDHPIPNHGAIRLTTARYYTPSGRSIQAKGIDPDIQVRTREGRDPGRCRQA